MMQRFFVCTFVVGAMIVPMRAQQQPRQQQQPGEQQQQQAVLEPPASPSERTGWVRMFNGQNLDGWDGPKDLWHVEDGSIVVRSKADPPTGSVYLIWQGGQPKDFEMKTHIKLEGQGANSGIQFRASLLGEVPSGNPRTKWETRGYQFDIINQSGAGTLIECCRGPRRGVPPRPDARASRGQLSRSSAGEGMPGELLSTFADAAVLRGYWKPNDWNDVHLIARGRVMMTLVNGHLMAVLIDDHPTMFSERGYIAIQLEGQGANTAWFKDIWLKNVQ